jgi:hypothetical protein
MAVLAVLVDRPELLSTVAPFASQAGYMLTAVAAREALKDVGVQGSRAAGQRQ